VILCILKKIIGANRHLVVEVTSGENVYQWKNEIPDNAWIVGDQQHKFSIEEAAKLFQRSVPSIAPDEHIKAFSEVSDDMDNQVIPWQWMLSSDEFKMRLNNTVEAASEAICCLEDSNYMKTYLEGREVLQKLISASVSTDKLNKYVDETTSGPSTISALKSFTPNEAGWAPLPQYSQTSTSTGRLIVKKGPSILTLPAKYRDLIKTRHRTGRIVQIDFVSLEPRVAKYLSGDPAPDDIYRDMCQELFDGDLDRKTVKLATLSALYGVSSKKMETLLGPGRNPNHVIRRVRRYFGLDRIEAELKSKMLSRGNIDNALGRPLFPNTSSSHVLVSHHIQSTAVDIALCGFRQLLQNFEAHGVDVSPLYLIHDALIIDVEEEQINSVKSIVSEGVKNDLGHFPVSLTGISRS